MMKIFWMVILCMLTGVVGVQADDEDMVPTIEVSASGAVSREPDQAIIQFSVETFAKTAKEATQENAQKMVQLDQQLKTLGIEKRAIRTAHYQVDPQYEYKEGHQKDPRPIGYRVHNTVEVDIADITKVGQVIDVAIEAGANRVMGLVFQVRDSDGAYREALTVAMKNARAQAEAIASGAGVKLGNLIWVNTSGRMPAPVYKTMRAEAMMAANTPIAGGEMDVVAHVVARYMIGQK